MRASLSLTLLLLALAAQPLPLAAELVLDGKIVDRSNRWDGYPTHLYINGVHRMWFCGQSPVTGADAIFYTENVGSLANLNGWSTPVELINHHDVPWANHHICDPTVIHGDFTYNSQSYSLALMFTANLLGGFPSGDNVEGVAFSNDGLNWVVHDDWVVEPDGGFDGSYGAGAGASAWGPESGTIHHAYRDTTTTFGTWRIRYKSSSDSINFIPTPSLDTLLSEASAADNGSAPDLAYHAPEALWYGAIQDISGGDPNNPVRILRATNQDDLFGTWQTIDSISSATTGEELNLLPGLARNKSSSLFVDPDG